MNLFQKNVKSSHRSLMSRRFNERKKTVASFFDRPIVSMTLQFLDEKKIYNCVTIYLMERLDVPVHGVRENKIVQNVK